jgi:cholesterol oxidase
MGAPTHYDVLIIGSGFGGSASALRLTEKGYRVGVLEAGRRFDADTLPETSWRVRRFLWAPKLRCFGIQRIHLLRNVVILAGAGVGGGSLVYANTLYEPSEDFFVDPQWKDITDWRSALAPFYDQAKRMLGVTVNPTTTPSDEVMRRVADDMGVGHTFRRAPVGVFFGSPGRAAPDPYFGGVGPQRRGCIECGECMTGCRHGAKNTLDTNYLHLAERAGARVHPLRTVTRVEPRDDGYLVTAQHTGRRKSEVFTATDVIFAAGAFGTQRLLHRAKATGDLPHLSTRLGELSRTNSESLVGAITRRSTRRRPHPDYSTGVAITSSFFPEPHTHVEPVRYGHGSNAMALLGTLQTDGDHRRWAQWLSVAARHPLQLARTAIVRGGSERTVIALVMQTLDNSLTVFGKRGLFGRFALSSKQGHGEPNPTWIPVANDVVRRIARHIGGWPAGTLGEILNIPMTAHFIGGAVIGAGPDTGVVDPYHRVFGHPGLHVMDGASVPANLGVNPSLTITALAERAAALWPNKGDADPRPPLGTGYRDVEPVTPRHPAVPKHAPAALRLTPRP